MLAFQCRSPVGAVSYETVTADGLKRDVLFCYDLKLPADFQPTAQVRHGSQNPASSQPLMFAWRSAHCGLILTISVSPGATACC